MKDINKDKNEVKPPTFKAYEQDILERLDKIVDPGARKIVQTASKIIEKQNRQAMDIIYTYDITLGGIGIFTMKEKKGWGVYRALSYVKMSLNNPNVKELTRYAAMAACEYIEALLKRVVHTWIWEKFKSEGVPLGTLLHRYKKHLPPELYENLYWLTTKIYNPAKHNINFENDDNEPENFFSITEAIATYFICRKLGLELEKLIGKSQEELESDYS